MEREVKTYYRWVAGELRPVTFTNLIEEEFTGPEGLKEGIIYAPASVCRAKMKGWGWKLRPYGIEANLENTKDYLELSKKWWIIPVPDEEYKNIQTSHVVKFPQLLEAYWRQFPKSDVIWSILDLGQPIIRDMALIVGNLAYDQQWRKKLRGIEYNPYFGYGGKSKESEEFVEETRKLIYNYMLSGEYGRQVHNPDMLWQISTNVLSSPAFFGYHTGFKSLAVSAKNHLNKIPVTKKLTEYLYKRMPHKVAYALKTTEDFEASKIAKSIFKELEPVLGKDTLAGLVNKGFGKTQGLNIMNERKIIRGIVQKAQEFIEPAWAKVSDKQKIELLKYWKTGKGQLDDVGKAFHSLVKGGMEKLSGRFILKPELVMKVQRILREVGGDAGVRDELLNKLAKECPFLTKKMRLKFKYEYRTKQFGELTRKNVVEIINDIDFSDTAKAFTKEVRKADYIPHKLATEQIERAINLSMEPVKYYQKARSTTKAWNPKNADEVVNGIITRIARPKVIEHYQKINKSVRSIGMDTVKTLKITSQETIKKIIEQSKKASLLPAAKKANIAKIAAGFWIDLVIMGRLPAFAMLNTVDDSFRMMIGVIDGLAEGRRPTFEMVKHWNKYNIPKEVYGKGFATALAHGDVNRLYGFDKIYNGLKYIGVEWPEQVRRVGFYKYSFFSRLDKLKRQGIDPTTAVQLARNAGIKDVDKWLFDYSRTLMLDTVIGKGAPFVKFYRNNWSVFLNMAVKNPWLVHSISKAWTAMEAIGAEEMPEHLKGYHKLFGEMHANPNYVFSWSPAWKFLSELDDKNLRDIPSRLERKFEKWEGYSKGFQKKMIEDDFEFASYVRSKQIPGVAKFFKVLGELTPLAPWASLPLGAAGVMEPEFWRAIIPQSDLIHELTGISIEPWLKENREERIKKRTVLEQVGQVIRGEEIDVDKAKEAATSRALIRSAKKLVTGGWLEQIGDWEKDFYNALNQMWSKETKVIEPTNEDLKPILNEYTDLSQEEAREVHIQGQISDSKELQKNFKKAVVENYPFLKVFFHLKDVEKLDKREIEMEKEIKKELRFLERTPLNVKNEVYKGLSFLKGLTLFPNDELGKKVIQTFIDTKPREWKKKFEKMSIDAKEFLVPLLKENSPQWLRDLSGPDPNPVPDAIPRILGNREDSVFDKMAAWLKGAFVNQAEAGMLSDYIKEKIGRVPTDTEEEKADKIKSRVKKLMNEYKSFRLESDFWLDDNPELRDKTFNKVRSWYRNAKAEDPAAIEYWADSDYKAYHQICENILEGKMPYGRIPTKLSEHTPEFIKAYLDTHLLDDIHEKDPDMAVYEKYLEIRDKDFEGKPYYKVGLESNNAKLKWEFAKFENKRKGKVTAEDVKAELRKTREGRVFQAKGIWEVIKNSGNPGQLVDELYTTNKPLFDTMNTEFPEFRPRIEGYKYDRLDRNYLRFADDYGFHPAVLDDIPKGVYSRLAMKDQRFSGLLEREGIRVEAPPAFAPVMRKKEVVPSLDILPKRDELFAPAKQELTAFERVLEGQSVSYEPLDPEIEREELADIPQKPSPESFSNIVSLLHWGRKRENFVAAQEERPSTLKGAVGQALGSIGREFKTNPVAIANMWPLASETINLGIQAGVFPKEDVPKIRDAVGVTSSVMAGTITGYKAASFLTNAALGGPVGMAMGALLFGLTSLRGISERKKARKAKKEWTEERRKTYEKQRVEREGFYAAQMVKRQAVVREQQTRQAKLAGEMYRKHLAAFTKSGLPIKKFKEQPEWFRSRFMREFYGPIKRYAKKPSYGSKIGLIRTIEKAIPKPRW